jgi:hypothetical protein
MAASIFGCAILAGCATASTSESPRDECVNYGDERVNALAWAPDGDRLALISTSLTTNESVVRAIDWPGLVGVEIDRSLATRPDAITAGPGTVGWLRDAGVTTGVRSYDVTKRSARSLFTTDDPIYGLQFTGGRALIANDVQGDGVRLEVRPPEDGAVLYESKHVVDSFRIASDGVLYVLEADVGERPTITIVGPRETSVIELATTAASGLSLDERGSRILYVDQSAGRLVARSMDGGPEEDVVIDRIMRAGEVSSGGVVAYAPWLDGEPSKVCFRS